MDTTDHIITIYAVLRGQRLMRLSCISVTAMTPMERIHAALINAGFNGIDHLKQGLSECDQKLFGFKILGAPGIDGYYCERGKFIMQADPIKHDANLKWLKKALLLTAMKHPLMMSWLY